MESDVVLLDNSPLANYIKSFDPNVETVDIEEEEELEKTKNVVSGHGVVCKRLALFNKVYQDILQDDCSCLEEDFADVMNGKMEEGRTFLYWDLLVCLLVIIACSLFWKYYVIICLPFVLYLWNGRRNREKFVLSGIERCHTSIQKFYIAMKHTLNLVREVELVNRGFRVGLTTQSPLSLMAKELRCLRLQRASLEESWNAFKENMLRLLSEIRPKYSSLNSDLKSVVCLLRETQYEDSIQRISKICDVTQICGSMGMIIVLRSLFLGCFSSISSLSVLETFCNVQTKRIQRNRETAMDWRTTPKERREHPSDFSSKQIASLQSSIRTIGAKTVLLNELKREKKEWKEEAMFVLRELEHAVIEWKCFCFDDDSSVEKTEEPKEKEKEICLERSTSSKNGLEIDVIGEKAETAQKETQKSEQSLSDILEVFLSKGRDEENDGEKEVRKPSKSREDRILEMKQRMREEENARQNARSLHVLMRELEDVIKKKNNKLK